MGKPIDFLWRYDFAMTPAEIWPHIADTSRLNQAIGLGQRQHKEVDGVVYVTDALLGLTQEWIEEPWEWVAGNYFYIRRRFSRGCGRYLRAINQVVERPDGNGITLYIYTGWIPRNAFWRLALSVGMPSFGRKIGRALKEFTEHSAANPQESTDETGQKTPRGRTFGRSAERRLSQVRSELLTKGISASAIEHLVTHIRRADALDLDRIRIVPLALKWRVPIDALLKVCLHATRLGLLNLTWDLICPHCRGVRTESSSLSELRPEGHCDICKISFDTAAPDAFEVTFHVHPSIHQAPKTLYCSAEPAKKPHVIVQKMVTGGGSLEFPAKLSAGRHRFRVIGGEPSVVLDVNPDSDTTRLAWNGIAPQQVTVAPKLAIKLDNPEKTARCFVLEELRWHSDALKPGAIFALPEFRDLFSEEYLAVDVKLDLGQQTIVFTDIVGSTRFYEMCGDARAFKDVRAHFKEIDDIVRQTGGIVVKTIGDAVMSAFTTPHSAVDAAVAIQNRFPPQESADAIRVRVSAHTGPVIAVSLNTGIDYFGNTVNFAAKLQARAGAGQIAVSQVFYDTVADYGQTLDQLTVHEDSFTAPGRSSADRVYVIAVG